MRKSILLLALAAAVTGCAGGADNQPAAHQQATHQSAADPAAPVSARVVLPSRTMTAGSRMSGRVVVDNPTGHAIRVTGCLGLFTVALTSSGYHPQVAWAACARAFTVPAGESSYRVTVMASYLACSPSHPGGGMKACLPGNRTPPLPPGTYRAALFQVSNIVPPPPAVTVRVTPK